MTSERRAILSLVSTGRITVAEAERLLWTGNSALEWGWMLVAVAAMVVAQLPAHGVGMFAGWLGDAVSAAVPQMQSFLSVLIQQAGGRS